MGLFNSAHYREIVSGLRTATSTSNKSAWLRTPPATVVSGSDNNGLCSASVSRRVPTLRSCSTSRKSLEEAWVHRAFAAKSEVPPEWQFQDDGYSGATLLRPGLEVLRGLAAEGQIQAVLIYSPDRLSRKYAYQVLLAEELARCGVDLIFLRAPSGATAEDQLLVQFQGMIAEYERAQIAERSRRGKRHHAQQGSINVLSGAPYGYRYVKKTDTSAACYEVVESEEMSANWIAGQKRFKSQIIDHRWSPKARTSQTRSQLRNSASDPTPTMLTSS